MTSDPRQHDVLPGELNLALGYAPAEFRAGFETLLRFDARLGAALAGAKEPQLARIRLAWWRDELTASEALSRRASDPLLGAIRTAIRRNDVTSTHLVRVIEGWAELLDTLPLTPHALSDYAQGRGGGLVAAAAAMVGSSAPESAGRAFALVDFARKCSDAASRDRALSLAKELSLEALPRNLRPFALLDDWALQDVVRIARGMMPLSLRRRAFSALTFAITGPR